MASPTDRELARAREKFPVRVNDHWPNGRCRCDIPQPSGNTWKPCLFHENIARYGAERYDEGLRRATVLMCQFCAAGWPIVDGKHLIPPNNARLRKCEATAILAEIGAPHAE